MPGNGILTYTTSEAIIIEYVSYGPVLDHYDFDYVFFSAKGPIQRPHIQLRDGHMSCMLTLLV